MPRPGPLALRSNCPAFGLALLLSVAAVAFGQQPVPRQLQNVGVDEKIGASVDLNLTFIAENGYPVALREFFHEKKPVILNLVYYNCPMLCNLLLNGQTTALRDIPWTPGDEFEIVTVSIDPTETFSLAQQKKAMYLTSYGKPAPGWHFLADNDGNVKKLADQVGFKYRYDESIRQYAHAAVLMVLTPDGRISRYLYGIKPKPRDLRLAITEASEFKFVQTIDRILLYCYHYDPDANSYVPVAVNMMRLGGLLFVIVFAFVLWRLFRGEKSRPASEGLVKP